MKTYTINQLKYADEVCYPNDFLKLFKKHAGNTPHAELATIYYNSFCGNHRRNLLSWIFGFSRAEMKCDNFHVIIEGMLDELIGNYL